ncbi:unnamed protein product [[Candida] boidinii]|uniref:Unnamed protein product n=1 Tax=Candida boidinii TaxID=5477 RepID=A0A9W6SXM1_CANBO|nr:unnamed protein product [[Candida] boidinii]
MAPGRLDNSSSINGKSVFNKKNSNTSKDKNKPLISFSKYSYLQSTREKFLDSNNKIDSQNSKTSLVKNSSDLGSYDLPYYTSSYYKKILESSRKRKTVSDMLNKRLNLASSSSARTENKQTDLETSSIRSNPLFVKSNSHNSSINNTKDLNNWFKSIKTEAQKILIDAENEDKSFYKELDQEIENSKILDSDYIVESSLKDLDNILSNNNNSRRGRRR